MNRKNDTKKVRLSDGTVIKVEVNNTARTKEVGLADAVLSFEGATKAIESISNDINRVWNTIKPNKMSVEFGIELEADNSDSITALLIKGKGKGTLNITLEWEQDKDK